MTTIGIWLTTTATCLLPRLGEAKREWAIQRDQDVTGLDALAARLQAVEQPPYAFHGRLLQKGLAEMPRNYSA